MNTAEEKFGMLVRTMLETRKNKRRGHDWVEFESHWSSALVQMFNQLTARTFRVDKNYTFLTSYPKWREIFATCAEGRIADHLLCDTLKPYIERVLHPRTFNNRENMGSMAAINQVIEDICEVSRGYTRPCRIIKWDLKGFFPSARCDYMEKCFCNVIEQYRSEITSEYDEDFPDFLKWLAMVCVHCNPADHCERRTPPPLWDEHIEKSKSLFGKPPGIGAPIGRMTSQTAMGLYINDEVKWLNDECDIRTTVFMDDGVMIVPEEQHAFALSLIPQLRKRLEAKGVRLNDRKFYDQPYQHGLEFLGCHIKSFRLHLNNKTFERALERIHEYNHLPSNEKYINLDRFISTVNSYTGMLKNYTDFKRLKKLVSIISPGWWQWLEWDERRQSIKSKPTHTFRARLNRSYNLKLKNNDTARKNRCY